MFNDESYREAVLGRGERKAMTAATSDNDRCAYYHSGIQMSCGGQRRFHSERYKDHDFVEPRQQPTQPAPDGGEWSYRVRVNEIDADLLGNGSYIGVVHAKYAAQIVADHHAVPKLVEALRQIKRKVNNAVLAGYARTSSYVVELSDVEALIDVALDSATTTQPDAGEGQG